MPEAMTKERFALARKRATAIEVGRRGVDTWWLTPQRAIMRESKTNTLFVEMVTEIERLWAEKERLETWAKDSFDNCPDCIRCGTCGGLGELCELHTGFGWDGCDCREEDDDEEASDD